MAVTPTGLYALTKDYLREAIARSAAWQALCGDGVTPADLSTARGQILVGEESTLPATPYLVIEENDGNALDSRRVGVGAFVSSAELNVTIFGTVPSDSQSSGRAAKVAADNVFGQLHDLLVAAHETTCADDGTLINISSVRRVGGPLFDAIQQTEDIGVPFATWKGSLAVRLGVDQ